MVNSIVKERIVVIGNGMVGYKFCERLTDKDIHGQFQIITFCEEPRIAYDRVHLSEYFAGKSAEDLSTLEYTPSFRHQPMVPYWMDGALKKALSIQTRLPLPHPLRVFSRPQTPQPGIHRSPEPPLNRERSRPVLEIPLRHLSYWLAHRPGLAIAK